MMAMASAPPRETKSSSPDTGRIGWRLEDSPSALHSPNPNRTNTYVVNTLADPIERDNSPEDPSAIPLHTTRYATNSGSRAPRRATHGRHISDGLNSTASSGTVGDNRLGRSLTLFRSKSRRHTHSKVITQSTVPPVPQVPVLQKSGKDASRLLTLDDVILVRICRYFDIENLLKFAHVSQRCRAMASRTLQLILQRTVLKATLCQERKAVFSLEFIFQHLDPSSMCAVFRASQLKSRRYFENSALARPQLQTLTLVTPEGFHHPLFTLAGFGPDSITDRDIDRATTLLPRPFYMDITEKGFYRVSPATSFMVDTPFFPAQPLLDRLTPFALESNAANSPPTWEMIYKVDRQPPNYPVRAQQQQARLNGSAVSSSPTRSNGPTSPTSPKKSSPLGRKSPASPGLNESSMSPTSTTFVPLPAIETGPSLRTVMDAKPEGGNKLGRKPTIVRPPPEGWGPLPPVAPPMPPNLSHTLGIRTVPAGTPGSPTQGVNTSSTTPMSGTHLPLEPSCLEPELAEETERFLTLLFIQFPIQTLFPHIASHAHRKNNNGLVSKLGRSLTLKKH